MKSLIIAATLAGLAAAAPLSAQTRTTSGRIIPTNRTNRQDCTYNQNTNSASSVIFGRNGTNTASNNCQYNGNIASMASGTQSARMATATRSTSAAFATTTATSSSSAHAGTTTATCRSSAPETSVIVGAMGMTAGQTTVGTTTAGTVTEWQRERQSPSRSRQRWRQR